MRKKTSKLEFTADELPPETADKKLTHARRKAERIEEKLAQAEKRLPSRKKPRMETVSDPDTGKAAKHLKFEKEVKPQRRPCKRICAPSPGKSRRQCRYRLCTPEDLSDGGRKCRNQSRAQNGAGW